MKKREPIKNSESYNLTMQKDLKRRIKILSNLKDIIRLSSREKDRFKIVLADRLGCSLLKEGNDKHILQGLNNWKICC